MEATTTHDTTTPAPTTLTPTTQTAAVQSATTSSRVTPLFPGVPTLRRTNPTTGTASVVSTEHITSTAIIERTTKATTAGAGVDGETTMAGKDKVMRLQPICCVMHDIYYNYIVTKLVTLE